MKKRRNDLIQLAILVVLGTAVVLSLVLPQLPGREREVQLLELSVIFRETDTALWSNTRLGMEQAAGDLGAELRFLTLTHTGDSGEQADLIRREVEGGAGALLVVPADPEYLGKQLSETAGSCPVVSIESPMEGAGMVVASWQRRCWPTGPAARCCCWIPPVRVPAWTPGWTGRRPC